MKILKYAFLLTNAMAYIGCDDDDGEDDTMNTAPEYSVSIMSPSTDDKNLNDAIHIHVNFDEANATTVHHTNVQIVQKGNEDLVIFDGPSEAHVHEESGHYELHADVVLDGTTGVQEHTDWILRAKVWGHEDGLSEVIEEIEFHVHPE